MLVIRWAYIRGAYIRGAYIRGAYIRGAYIRDFTVLEGCSRIFLLCF